MYILEYDMICISPPFLQWWCTIGATGFSIAGFMSLFLSNKLGWCVVFKVQTILDFPAMGGLGRPIRQGAKTSRYRTSHTADGSSS